jgi:hypothetical protein
MTENKKQDKTPWGLIGILLVIFIGYLAFENTQLRASLDKKYEGTVDIYDSYLQLIFERDYYKDALAAQNITIINTLYIGQNDNGTYVYVKLYSSKSTSEAIQWAINNKDSITLKFDPGTWVLKP